MTPIDVTPRSAGDPRPDTLGVRLAHRAMLRDAARLLALARAFASGTTEADADRGAAVGAYVADYCDSVRSHHAAEVEDVWPVLSASAGPLVHLGGLGDDSAALDALLARVRSAGTALAARPDSEDVATALAVELAELRDVLEQHIADEEASLLPAIEEHVSVADWAAVEARMRRRTKLGFEDHGYWS